MINPMVIINATLAAIPGVQRLIKLLNKRKSSSACITKRQLEEARLIQEWRKRAEEERRAVEAKHQP